MQGLRWALVLALVGLCCWLVNVSVFHWWAAGGPPTTESARSYHERWGNLLFVAAIAALAVGISVGWALRRRPVA